MQTEDVLKNIVRIGTVFDVDTGARKARIRFHDVDMTSDWLYVLNNRPYIPDYEGPQQTELQDGHIHELIIKGWMPKIDDVVVALYLPIFNADGFIIGGVG